MKRGTPDHPKTAALARSLAIPVPYAVGLLEMLWHFTARYQPRGDVGRWPNATISTRVQWPGDPDVLVGALVREGFLDEHHEHRLIVHDWDQHADDTTKKFLSRNKLKFATMSRQKADRRRTRSVPRTELVAPAVAGAVAGPLPPPEPLPDSPQASEQGPLKNPLIDSTGGRGSWETRWTTAVTLLSEITDRDPVEVARKHSLYPGARTAKLNPAAMTDDRLMHTVDSLEAALAAERARRAAAPNVEMVRTVLAARAAEPPTLESVTRHLESLAAAFAGQGASYTEFCAQRAIPLDVADKAGLRALCERAS